MYIIFNKENKNKKVTRKYKNSAEHHNDVIAVKICVALIQMLPSIYIENANTQRCAKNVVHLFVIWIFHYVFTCISFYWTMAFSYILHGIDGSMQYLNLSGINHQKLFKTFTHFSSHEIRFFMLSFFGIPIMQLKMQFLPKLDDLKWFDGYLVLRFSKCHWNYWKII